MSRTLPVDPTVSDPPPAELLERLPSDVAFQRVLAAIRIDPERAGRGDRTQVIAELSEVDRGRAAAQVRFAAPRTLHYYRVPALGRLDAAELTDRVKPDAFGAQFRAVEEHHDRVYAVCSVPEGGAQAQISVSEAQRETTVATFEPGSELLAVRASDVAVADATVGAVLSGAEQQGAERLALWEDSVRGLFEDACLSSYGGLVFTPTSDASATERIDIGAKDTGDGPPRDLREDSFVQDLLREGSLVLSEGRAVLDSDVIEPAIAGEAAIGCSIDFAGGYLSLDRFEPESVLIALDKTIETVL